MRLTRSTLHTEVDGRPVTVQGEALLPGHGSPEFVVYANSIQFWDDGKEIGPREKRRIIVSIEEEAKREGRQIEIE